MHIYVLLESLFYLTGKFVQIDNKNIQLLIANDKTDF